MEPEVSAAVQELIDEVKAVATLELLPYEIRLQTVQTALAYTRLALGRALIDHALGRTTFNFPHNKVKM